MGIIKMYAEMVGNIKTTSNKHAEEELWGDFVTMTKSLLSLPIL